MILSEMQLASAPWAVLPDRLPFIRAALSVSAGEPLPQARAFAAANAGRRSQTGNGAIAVLPFYGIAVQRTDALGEARGLLSLWHFSQAIRAALADDSIGGIVIDVNSPGGSVYGVMELADEIYRSRARKPIFAVANRLAASAAYWIASAAKEFYVTPGGEVGAIGVVAAHENMSRALGKAGVEATLIAAGKYKTEGNAFQPLGADARATIQRRIDEYYDAFVAAVAKHRNVTEAAVRGGMGQGRLLDAARAKPQNMVDGIGTLDEVVDRLAERIREGTGATVRSRPVARETAIHRVTAPAAVERPELNSPSASAAGRKRVIEFLSL